MNPVLDIILLIGFLFIEACIFIIKLADRNEKIADLENEVKIRDKRIDKKNDIILQRNHEISELYETAVRMKENNKELSRNNEFLQPE
jgi:uncharacterized protein (DUF3084 family)